MLAGTLGVMTFQVGSTTDWGVVLNWAGAARALTDSSREQARPAAMVFFIIRCSSGENGNC